MHRFKHANLCFDKFLIMDYDLFSANGRFKNLSKFGST